MARTFKCMYNCGEPISEVGGYVKLALTRWAHLECHEKAVTEKILQEQLKRVQFGGDELTLHESMISDIFITRYEQARVERERIIEEERKKRETQAKLDQEIRLRNYASSLPRCKLCGRRMNQPPKYTEPQPLEDVRRVYPEAQEPSAGPLGRPDACAACVEAERIASNAAKQAAPPKAPDAKAPEVKKDRIELLDLD